MNFAKKIVELYKVDSTNNYALELIKQFNAQHGTCVFAHIQTAGKGQMGKQWLSAPNENLTISVVIDINNPIFASSFSIIALTAVATCNFVKKIINKPVAIKWPNDIYINDKKAGGILVETTKVNKNKFAVIGIGLNIHQTVFEEHLKRATSIKLESGRDFDLKNLTEHLWESILYYYSLWEGFTLSEILDVYNSMLYKKNEIVKLKKGTVITKGTLKGVNIHGELVVENALWDTFTVGSVEWVFD